MALKDALQKFSDAVEDLATLEVQTYGGKLESTDVVGQKINWDKFVPTGESNLKLVAATRISPDFDAVNFQSSDTDITNRSDLLALHQATLESSQAGRAQTVEMFKDLITGLG